MPVVGDLPVLDAIYINCAKADRATVAFHVFEAAAEMSREGVPNNGAIVINVLGFMAMEWFGFSAGSAMQLLRLELRPPSAWRRRPSDSLLLLQPCGFWLVRRTTVRGPG